jgi:hypothetical protein
MACRRRAPGGAPRHGGAPRRGRPPARPAGTLARRRGGVRGFTGRVVAAFDPACIARRARRTGTGAPPLGLGQAHAARVRTRCPGLPPLRRALAFDRPGGGLRSDQRDPRRLRAAGRAGASRAAGADGHPPAPSRLTPSLTSARERPVVPLFFSADAYIKMWERAEAAARRMARPMTVTIDGGNHGQLETDSPQTFTVNAKDLYFDTLVQNGDVFIGDNKIGQVGSPITQTFHSSLGYRCSGVGREREGRERECTPQRESPVIEITVRANGFIDGAARLKFISPN